MAYAFTVSDPVIENVAGRKHVVYEITETDVGTTDEWHVAIPKFATVVLFEGELTDAGSATQIDPELGLAAGWTADTLDEVWPGGTAATYIREQLDKRVYSESAVLYGRSTPDNTANEIVTRIVVVEGCDA